MDTLRQENPVNLDGTTESSQKRRLIWGLAGFMGLFAGLCTIFVLVVTVAEAWQEHAEARWPEAMARVEQCGLDQTSYDQRNRYYIDCRLSYRVDTEDIVAKIYSGNAPSPDVWQYPPNQLAPLEEWVEKHPAGTPIAVQYNPRNHKKAVLVVKDMPRGGPHTAGNLKLLCLTATVCIVLVSIARIARPQSSPVV